MMVIYYTQVNLHAGKTQQHNNFVHTKLKHNNNKNISSVNGFMMELTRLWGSWFELWSATKIGKAK